MVLSSGAKNDGQPYILNLILSEPKPQQMFKLASNSRCLIAVKKKEELLSATL